jgi:hypothetical protein
MSTYADSNVFDAPFTTDQQQPLPPGPWNRPRGGGQVPKPPRRGGPAYDPSDPTNRALDAALNPQYAGGQVPMPQIIRGTQAQQPPAQDQQAQAGPGINVIRGAQQVAPAAAQPAPRFMQQPAGVQLDQQGKPVIPVGADGRPDMQQFLQQLPAQAPATGYKSPMDVPLGASKGIWQPPPGMSPQGAAALRDMQGAWNDWLRSEVEKLTPPASPMEEWARNNAAPLIIRGSGAPWQPTQFLSDSSHQHNFAQDTEESGSSTNAASSGARGGGGSTSSATQSAAERFNNAIGDTYNRREVPMGPVQPGTTWMTPWGEVAQRPDADLLQYAREQQGRNNLLAALDAHAKTFPQLYQSQAAMADAALRAQYEYGPARLANEAGIARFNQVLNQTGDYEAANRAMQDTKSNYLAMNGGPMLPGQPQQPGLTPDQALDRVMRAGQGQGGGKSPPMSPQTQPGVGGFTDQAIRELLQQATVLNAQGKTQSQNIDALKLGETLANNPEYVRRGLGAVARTMLDAGLPPEKVAQGIDQAMIRYANEADFGGIGGLNHPGEVGFPEAQPVTYGEYSIMPTYAKPGALSTRPMFTGWTVKGPGTENWYPRYAGVKDPYFDLVPTVKEQTKADYRSRGQALAALRAAMVAELNRRAASQAAGTPGR